MGEGWLLEAPIAGVAGWSPGPDELGGDPPCLEPHHQGQYLPRASGLTQKPGGEEPGASQSTVGLHRACVCVAWAKGVEVGLLGDTLA